jgi:hypothetical protein
VDVQKLQGCVTPPEVSARLGAGTMGRAQDENYIKPSLRALNFNLVSIGTLGIEYRFEDHSHSTLQYR